MFAEGMNERETLRGSQRLTFYPRIETAEGAEELESIVVRGFHSDRLEADTELLQQRLAHLAPLLATLHRGSGWVGRLEKVDGG